jgi:hypothetical protein
VEEGLEAADLVVGLEAASTNNDKYIFNCHNSHNTSEYLSSHWLTGGLGGGLGGGGLGGGGLGGCNNK